MLPQFNPRLNLKMHSDKIRIRVQRLKLSKGVSSIEWTDMTFQHADGISENDF